MAPHNESTNLLCRQSQTQQTQEVFKPHRVKGYMAT